MADTKLSDKLIAGIIVALILTLINVGLMSLTWGIPLVTFIIGVLIGKWWG